MTNDNNPNDIFLKCASKKQAIRVDYFTKVGIIILTIIFGLLTVGFYYLIFSSDFHSSGTGKLIVFGTVAIAALLFKITNIQKEIFTYPHCEPAVATEA